jgi:hypothetical protein
MYLSVYPGSQTDIVVASIVPFGVESSIIVEVHIQICEWDGVLVKGKSANSL